ncbi:MAG: tetratricopeptide repeat protein [Myxococcales bacterium]
MRNLRKLLLVVGLALLAPAAAFGQAETGQMNKALQAYNDGDYETSAFLLYDLAENAAAEEVRLKSEYYLAQSYFKKGLYNAALRQYSYVMQAGPNHPYYFKSVEGIINISEVLREDFITGALLDKEYNDDFIKLGDDYLAKVNYIVGVVSYRKNKLKSDDGAIPFLNLVTADSSYYARARYLLGVIYARNGENDKAIASFEDVLKLKDSLKLQYADLAEIKQLADLGLARTYYGMGRYADAVKHYDAIPRFSEYWDEALFENGWARFQNEDPGGALGSLQALHAPQFAGSFQPESWILKATVYYFACLYEDSKDALDYFDRIYLPINEQLKSLLDGERSNDFYYDLLANDSSKLPKSVKNYLRANHRLVQFKNYIDQLQKEKETISSMQAWRNSRMQQDLLGNIDQSRELAIQIAGNFVKRRLDDASKTISGFDVQKDKIKLEIGSAEEGLLELGLDQKKHLGAQAIYRPQMPGSNWEYWQFQGEFWLDEIGYYQYTLKSGCIRRENE